MIEEILLFIFAVFGTMIILCCTGGSVSWRHRGWHTWVSFFGFIIFGILVIVFR